MSNSHEPQNKHDEQDLTGLKQYEEQWNHIQIPNAKLDQAIYLGMERGRRKKKWIRPLKWSGIAASLFIIILLSMIRFSPTVAAYVSQIPGMESIVTLITQDKGLQHAVKHDWIQTIDAAAEHEGIKLSVDQVILDETRMLLFYTIENGSTDNAPRLNRIELLDGNGGPYKNYVSWGQPIETDEPNAYQGKIEFGFDEHFEIPDQMTFRASVDVTTHAEASQYRVGEPVDDHSTPLDPVWAITFDIDRGKFQSLKKVYAIDQTAVIEGQKIHFHEAIVFPTRTSLIVEFDETNTKEILGFDDIRLVNEQGEEFRPSNGITSTGGARKTFYFESNFFDDTDVFDLKFSSLRALEKNQLEVVLDLEKQQFIKKPDDRLQLEAINVHEHYIDLRYRLRMDSKWDSDQFYSPLYSIFVDSKGNEYHSSGSSSSSSSFGEQFDELNMVLPKENYAGPLTFTIWNYPTRIEGETSIQINLEE